MDMKDVNRLKVQYRHVDSNVVWTEIFERNYQNKEDTRKEFEVEEEDEDPFGDYDDWK